MWNSIISGIGSIVTGLASPVAKVFEKKQERKQAVETAKIELHKAKQAGEKEVTLTDAQWESIMAEKTDSTWKDEYVTITVLAPLNFLLAGGIIAAFTENTMLLDGTVDGIKAINTVGVDLGLLMVPVVYAAIGLKMWRAK